MNTQVSQTALQKSNRLPTYSLSHSSFP